MSITHRIRTHPRARHVRLRVDPHDGVIVTVPPGFDQSRIPELLAQRADWLEKVQRRLKQQRAGLDPGLEGMRPDRIELSAFGESWAIGYRTVSGRRARLNQHNGRLELLQPQCLGHDELDALTGAALRRWLMARARDLLVPETRRLAQQHGFGIGRITIRNQRSRWGSCSARANISLNARLLLCSPAACRYVLLHELVHTEHLDHSPAFWRRLAELVPDHRDCSAELRTTWQRLPAWVHATDNNQNHG